MINILFVEDDKNLGMLLKESLELKGYNITWCKNGIEGMNAFEEGDHDICLLDIMLPSKDGYELAKHIRMSDKDVPIIFVTSKSLQADKIRGFEYGCDDYVTKPFSTQELSLRIRAILKRVKKDSVAVATIAIGKFVFDAKKMTLEYGDNICKLSSKECELIKILAENEGVLVQRKNILKHIWGDDNYFSAKSMDVYISKIRKYFKPDPEIEILNAYGIGFKLIVNSTSPSA